MDICLIGNSKIHTQNQTLFFITSSEPLEKCFFCNFCYLSGASLVAQLVKNLPAVQETWVRKIPWRRKRQPTPVSLPGKSHGQKSLVGYSPWDCKESGKTGRLTLTYLLSISVNALPVTQAKILKLSLTSLSLTPTIPNPSGTLLGFNFKIYAES